MNNKPGPQPVMERSQAQVIVDPLIFKVDQYQAVTHAAARDLLGEERFARLMADKIRNLGPNSDTVYPWNVVDYVHVPDLNKHR